MSKESFRTVPETFWRLFGVPQPDRAWAERPGRDFGDFFGIWGPKGRGGLVRNASLRSRLFIPATEPPDPRRVYEGVFEGVSEGFFGGFQKGFRQEPLRKPFKKVSNR